MKIIFAQGNPGSQYVSTRHNVGFMMLDRLAEDWQVPFIAKSKFHADIAELTIEGEKVLLVKPTTFYNETGHAAQMILGFYKLTASHLLVIHDELALPLGTVKTRFSGSNAGNNGIKSLNAQIGQNYARIRIGVYTPLRDITNDADFVLGKFSRDELHIIERVYPTVKQFTTAFLHGSLEATKISHVE